MSLLIMQIIMFISHITFSSQQMLPSTVNYLVGKHDLFYCVLSITIADAPPPPLQIDAQPREAFLVFSTL